jgi:hypothetical protein
MANQLSDMMLSPHTTPHPPPLQRRTGRKRISIIQYLGPLIRNIFDSWILTLLFYNPLASSLFSIKS